MSRVKPSGKVLEWALGRNASKRPALQKKFPNLDAWIDGSAEPTLKQLESFAKATATPLGFFFLKQPPKVELSIPHFRTLSDDDPAEPSTELIDTVQLMERRQAWARDYFIREGYEPLDFIASQTVNDRPDRIADAMRKILKLDVNWASKESNWTDALRLLRNRIEDARIMVFTNGIVGNNTTRKLEADEFRGFVLVDNFAPLVFVNGADAKAAQMFMTGREFCYHLQC